MRPISVALAILALLLDGFAVFQAVHQAVHAILNPVSCPSAFLGCSANGEESSYTAALWSDVVLLVAGLLSVILGGRVRSGAWRVITAVTFTGTVLLFPLPLGMVAAIFLSTIAPGVGVFSYLVFSVAAGAILLAFGLLRPARPRGEPRPSTSS
jgi:hypothetical protein